MSVNENRLVNLYFKDINGGSTYTYLDGSTDRLLWKNTRLNTALQYNV